MEGEDYNALEKLQLNDAALVFEPESSQASSPADLPDPGAIEEIREPWMRIQVFTPVGHLENLNGLWLSSYWRRIETKRAAFAANFAPCLLGLDMA